MDKNSKFNLDQIDASTGELLREICLTHWFELAYDVHHTDHSGKSPVED